MSLEVAEKANEHLCPCIGIMCIDIAQSLQNIYKNEYDSYIAASCVKYLEAAGCRVVPIWINRNRSYYEDIMKCINGVLLPGGAVYLNNRQASDEHLQNYCVESAKFILEIATELNDRGVYFPIWGICLGFQLMLTHSAKVEDIRSNCCQMKCSIPLQFENDKVLKQSKLFGKLSADLKEKMSTIPFGYHWHRYCITKQNLIDHQIDKDWEVLATNHDSNGLEFISIIEHKRYPFFGSQIHLERVHFESLIGDTAFCHTMECLELTQYFAKFFINCCRRNTNRFYDLNEQLDHLIYNFPIKYTSQYKLHWQQCYLFHKTINYPCNSIKED